MNALRKSLMAVSAVLAVSPAAAFAYPPQCKDAAAVSTEQAQQSEDTAPVCDAEQPPVVES
ncbi:hypothetical protein HJC10_02190 [Corallococcus exiguus]|nr:hypothetical protein [Corallococcus exiguus]